ncbi:MAG TPA: N-acetyltransferase, partial [Thermoanaerobaculia bacterium]|nr:N-acetyltransferase [Thermoanaerobaculia bacterium]
PLRSDVRWMLDVSKNPFWHHAKRELFLARKDGRVVGRIAAIVDDEHNRVHGEKTGFFGFFECEEDREAASALLGAAEAWAQKALPGCERLRGPVNPSLNDECAALLPAESEPGIPFIMMTYNPAYYLDLFGAAGYAKVKDLVAILAPVGDVSFKRLARLADGVRRREPKLVVRPIRMDHFDEDLAIVKTIYNGAWEKNWGFVPMTSEEIDAMAKKLKPILHPPYILFAEIDGKPAAFHLALPDFNQVLAKMKGSLFPFGWLTFLLEKGKIDRCRTMALGVLPEYRKRGIDAVLYYEAMKEGIRIGHKWAEFSWMLEDNLDILKPLEVFGGRVYRRYRIVEKPLG